MPTPKQHPWTLTQETIAFLSEENNVSACSREIHNLMLLMNETAAQSSKAFPITRSIEGPAIAEQRDTRNGAEATKALEKLFHRKREPKYYSPFYEVASSTEVGDTGIEIQFGFHDEAFGIRIVDGTFLPLTQVVDMSPHPSHCSYMYLSENVSNRIDKTNLDAMIYSKYDESKPIVFAQKTPSPNDPTTYEMVLGIQLVRSISALFEEGQTTHDTLEIDEILAIFDVDEILKARLGIDLDHDYSTEIDAREWFSTLPISETPTLVGSNATKTKNRPIDDTDQMYYVTKAADGSITIDEYIVQPNSPQSGSCHAIQMKLGTNLQDLQIESPDHIYPTASMTRDNMSNYLEHVATMSKTELAKEMVLEGLHNTQVFCTGTVRIPDHSIHIGNIECGELILGRKAKVIGKTKSQGKVSIGEGAIHDGDIEGRSVTLNEGSIVDGSISSLGDVDMEPQSRVFGEINAGGSVKWDKHCTIKGDVTADGSISGVGPSQAGNLSAKGTCKIENSCKTNNIHCGEQVSIESRATSTYAFIDNVPIVRGNVTSDIRVILGGVSRISGKIDAPEIIDGSYALKRLPFLRTKVRDSIETCRDIFPSRGFGER